MNQSLENNFGNDDDYKDLFAKKIYMFVLNQIRKEETWPIHTCKDIAHDVTMDAITELLDKERSGLTIGNRYSYLMAIVKNSLKQKKFIFHKNVRKCSVEMVTAENSLISYMISDQNLPNSALNRRAELDFATIVFPDYEITRVLSPEEKSIAKLMDDGYSGKEIAIQTGRSESTISRIIASIRFKLGKYKP